MTTQEHADFLLATIAARLDAETAHADAARAAHADPTPEAFAKVRDREAAAQRARTAEEAASRAYSRVYRAACFG